MTTESDQKPPASSAPVTQNEGLGKALSRQFLMMSDQGLGQMLENLTTKNVAFTAGQSFAYQAVTAFIAGYEAARSSDEGTEERSA